MAKLLRVRATVSLTGLQVGAIVDVDPENSYMRMLLDAGALTPVDGVWPPEVAEQPTGAE